MEEENAQLRERVDKLEALVLAQAELIEKLQAQLGKHAKNSHTPPSSDPPQARSEHKRRTRSQKKPGGQPGHKGSPRQMLDADQLDHLTCYWSVSWSSRKRKVRRTFRHLSG